MDIAEEIKQRLSMTEVVRRYGFEPNRAGFICCPFHREKTPSLKIYSEPGRGFNCYGCGAGGSAIDFTMLLFKIPFAAAVARLNSDFRLGLIKTNDRPDPHELEKLRAEQLEKEIAVAYSHEQYARLQHYYAWLRSQTQTAAILFDTEYIGRQLDMYLDRDSQITWDVTAMVEALLSKHDNADEFKWTWVDGKDWPPPHFFHQDCELIY